MNKWKLLKTDPIHESKWLSLFSDTYEMPDGQEGSGYLRLKRDDYVVIFAINDKNEVIVEQQFRRGVDKVILELPAGGVNQNESPEETAKRELMEETGYEATNLKSFMLYPQPAYIEQKAYIVFCNFSDTKSQTNLEHDEYIDFELIKLPDLEKMVVENKIYDNSLITALGLYKLVNSHHD